MENRMSAKGGSQPKADPLSASGMKPLAGATIPGGKILILGAKGNLGGQLMKIFAPGNEVIGWDKSEIDITDRELILKKVGDIKPDLVINAAAYNAVDKCEENDDEYELAKKINIDGPKFLAEACLKIGAVLIYYSTDYVFEGKRKRGYLETDQPKPINRYGKTKFHGEKRILEFSGRGLKWYLIRTSKLFGPKGESDLAKPSFFDLLLKLSGERKALEVVNEEVSCFTYTPDLAKATKELIASGRGYGIYHIVNGGACTWYEAALELFEIRLAATPQMRGDQANENKEIKVKVVPISSAKLARPAKRPKYSVLLNTKLPPLRDYREALREYLGK